MAPRTAVSGLLLSCCAAAAAASVEAAAVTSRAVGTASTPRPMNPGKYTIANAKVKGSFRGEYFDIYGPDIKTRYSEVYWRTSTIPLPAEIVQRFDGRAMAITGMEVDIVRAAANGSDVSVPCYELYNHHFSNYIYGKSASMVQAPKALHDAVGTHTMHMDGYASHPVWAFDDAVPRVLGEAGAPVPRVQVFSEGNGNEHRSSYKGSALGFAQLIESPTSFHSGPMIINTNKRLTDDISAGPINNKLLPRSSLAPQEASYSGLAECPCTSRIPKLMDGYFLQDHLHCSAAVTSAAECSWAWGKASGVATNVSLQVEKVSSDELPPGCSAHSDGSSLTFNYNDNSLVFCGADGRVCPCRSPDTLTGLLGGYRFDGLAPYCAPSPNGELLTTHNAICDLRAYNGGLLCCGDGALLLDEDQEVPVAEDTWRMKYRFYFENYTNQHNTFRVWWSTEATNNEYDVPKSTANCSDPSTPPADCVHTIRSKFHGVDVLSLGSGCMEAGDANACGNVTRIRDEDGGRFQLVYAGPHCHAPACQSMELWNDDTGELLCSSSPEFGHGTAAMDEAAYVMSIPPCIWGSAAEGLKPPPQLLLNSNLTVVKRANNTNGHWGVMALWQMRAAYVDRPAKAREPSVFV